MSAPPPPYNPYLQYPPQTGAMMPQPQQAWQPNQGQTTNQNVVVNPTIVAPAQPNITVVTAPPTTQVVQYPAGSCPRCGGEIDDKFTCYGICCCILFFPIGLICLYIYRDKKCDSCGKSF